MARRPAILIGLLFALQVAGAEVWYVHAELGNDFRPGTAAAPFRTLGRLAVAAKSGDTCRIAGTFRDQSLILTGVSDCTIEQWGGEAPAVVRADREISGFAPADGAHAVTLSERPISLATVVVDWDTSLGADGRRRAHLRPVPRTLVSKVNNSYSYESATGVLLVRLDGSDPNLRSMGYVTAGRNGFWFRVPGLASPNVGNTVRGITFALWADGSPGRGNGVLMEHSRGALIDACRFEDSGYHAWSFPAGICENVVVRDCFAAGLASGGIGGAFYAGGAGVVGARVTALAQRCHVLANCLLDPLGMPVVAGGSSGGFISHTDGINGNVVASVEYVDCTVEGYTPPAGQGARDNAFYSRDATSASNKFDPRTYAVRAEQCRIVNGVSSLSPGGIAFVRSRIDLSRACESGAAAGGVLGDAGGAPPGAFYGFFATEIVVDLDAPIPATGMVFNCRGNAEVVIVNSSVYDRGVGGAGNSHAWRFMFNYGGSGTATAAGSIFAYRATGVGNATRFLCANDLQVGAAQHAFVNCAIRGVTEGFYSGNQAINQRAEWTALVDAGAVYPEPNPFQNTSGANLDLAEPLRSVQRPTDPHAPRGFNGRMYDGRFGAWQYGPCATDLNADGFVTGEDFDLFVEFYEAGVVHADFDSDGFVSGPDFDQFVRSFEAGCE